MNAPILISKRLADAIIGIWQQIGPDVIDACDADNEQAIEVCATSDQLNPASGYCSMNDDIGAWADWQTMLQLHGYRAVLKAMAADPRLQLI